jgi:hypothetical protein
MLNSSKHKKAIKNRDYKNSLYFYEDDNTDEGDYEVRVECEYFNGNYYMYETKIYFENNINEPDVCKKCNLEICKCYKDKIYIVLNNTNKDDSFTKINNKYLKKNIIYEYENHFVVKREIKKYVTHIFENENIAKLFMRRINYCLFLKSIENNYDSKTKIFHILNRLIMSYL